MAHATNPKAKDHLVEIIAHTRAWLDTYQGVGIFMYADKHNEQWIDNPEKWIFYYKPIMLPILNKEKDKWIWTDNNEIQTNIQFGNEEVNDMVRNYMKIRLGTIHAQHSSSWTVTATKIHSFNAYIINRTAHTPVSGVKVFSAVQPNSDSTIFRFECSSAKRAREIVEEIDKSSYYIHMAIYVASDNQMSPESMPITTSQFEIIFDKTMADGSNHELCYIHRSHKTQFLSKLLVNVNEIISKENSNVDMTLITNQFEEEFSALWEQAMFGVQKQRITVDYKRVWSSSDLNLNSVTDRLNKQYTFNKDGTQRRNDGIEYYNDYRGSSDMILNERKNVRCNFKTKIAKVATYFWTKIKRNQHNLSYNQNEVLSYHQLQYRISKEDDLLVELYDHKLRPKYLYVYKLRDIADYFQIAIINKQYMNEEKNNPTIRSLYACNLPTSINPRQNSELEENIADSQKDLVVMNLTDLDMHSVVKQAIINKRCTTLDLKIGTITSVGASVVADLLYNNTTLENLNFSSNQLSDEGVHFLAKALSTNNNTLKSLDLSNNSITDLGAKHLSQMLKRNTTLTRLVINKNQITDHGFQLMVKVLENHNNSLEELQLVDNQCVTDRSVDSLYDLIKHNQSLKRICLSNNAWLRTDQERLFDAQEFKKEIDLTWL